ncbi:MAG TPA: hypothetical protein PK079_13400 [Leptospiraceae bacterium]|nr:hypothetical protein [Leptospiraceae bacterium]HMW05312.1 hypothetical protein [Leptospiraceae bacterium]HMX32931.1 hypothetical protein [Leptospiraceae bacterium]HMY31508.1 hypothetical protein [Leptospiraceae bacterium]HMZ66299.1 hypothetical protein [Leptospiraceae bacterium]
MGTNRFCYFHSFTIISYGPSSDDAEKYLHLVDDGQIIYHLTIGFTVVKIEGLLPIKSIEYKNSIFETRFDKIQWFKKNNIPVPDWI